jgi:predicted kinase
MLFLLCGKIAAGKSTIARQLAARPMTLLISEDHWLSHLFLDDLKSLDDYRRVSARLRAAMEPHVINILQMGLSVVLDFPANTVSNRNWMRSLTIEAHTAHELHFLDVSDTSASKDFENEMQAANTPSRLLKRTMICSPAISSRPRRARGSTS